MARKRHTAEEIAVWARCIKTTAGGSGSMIKSELVARLAARYRLSHLRDADRVVSAILEAMTKALARGQRVELRGFGAFSVKQRAPPPRSQSTHGRGGHSERKAAASLSVRQGDAGALERDCGVGAGP